MGAARDGGSSLHQLCQRGDQFVARVRPDHVCFTEMIIGTQDGDVLSKTLRETAGPVVVTAQDGNRGGVTDDHREVTREEGAAGGVPAPHPAT